MGAGKKQGRDVTSCQKVAHILENLRWIVSAMWQQVLHWEVYLGNIDIILFSQNRFCKHVPAMTVLSVHEMYLAFSEVEGDKKDLFAALVGGGKSERLSKGAFWLQSETFKLA